MPLYTFFLHDGPQSTPRFELELLETRDAAVAHGRTLLARRPHYSAVTVTEADTEIARLEHQAA